MPLHDRLRVIDLGSRSPLRSQTIWHALAHGVSEGSPPTLSMLKPNAPYVSIGFHRRLEELDLDACASRGLPVYRRMVGGGPVYLDGDQLFFQISVPMTMLPISRPKAMQTLLEPAVEAFKKVGVPAEFDERGDISIGRSKISGIGGGQIELAGVAVGNLVQRFDYEAMADILNLPLPQMRGEVVRLMKEFFVPTPADEALFSQALIESYGAAFGLDPQPGRLTGYEETKLGELDALFVDQEWLAGAVRPEPKARQVKIRSGVWVFAGDHEGSAVVGSVVADRIDRLLVSDERANGAAAQVGEAVAGKLLVEAPAIARTFGATGARVAELIETTDGRQV